MDEIVIKDLEVFGYHGVLEAEKVLGQKFIVSIKLKTVLREAGCSDQLEDTTSYAEIIDKVVEFFSTEKYNLIETVAEHLCEMILLNYSKIHSVDVSIKKPWAPIHHNMDCVGVKISRKWHVAYIGLGSNIGDRFHYIEQALELIDDSKTTYIVKKSKLIETIPVGVVEQNQFINSVIEVKTLLTPQELLEFLLNIEKSLNRTRTIKWGPRTIDLDILLYDDLVLNEPNLCIPHPEMLKRMFVLEPLSEIAPYRLHPIARRYIIDLKHNLQE